MLKLKGIWLAVLTVLAVMTGVNWNNLQVSAKTKELSNTQVNEVLTKAKLYRPSKIKSD